VHSSPNSVAYPPTQHTHAHTHHVKHAPASSLRYYVLQTHSGAALPIVAAVLGHHLPVVACVVTSVPLSPSPRCLLTRVAAALAKRRHLLIAAQRRAVQMRVQVLLCLHMTQSHHRSVFNFISAFMQLNGLPNNNNNKNNIIMNYPAEQGSVSLPNTYHI